MSTKIEWADEVWNPLRGCSRVSSGCERCYAEKIAARFSGPGRPYEGLATRGPARWTGEVVLAPEKTLTAPLRWRKPRRVVVNSMSDLFHERVPDEWIDRIFAVMALAPQHTFMVLTKRPERMRQYFRRGWDYLYFGWEEDETFRRHMRDGDSGNKVWCQESAARVDHARTALDGPLPNVWLGVSVEDQATADERIPLLLDTPAAVRFASCEPLLGPIKFANVPGFNLSGQRGVDLLRDWWVIVGGESGPDARPFDPEWARDIVAQCRAASVACFVKQMGSNIIGDDGYRCDGCRVISFRREMGLSFIRDPKGGDPSEWPLDLRVRQSPEVAS